MITILFDQIVFDNDIQNKMTYFFLSFFIMVDKTK
jgi:hypothetical protein